MLGRGHPPPQHVDVTKALASPDSSVALAFAGCTKATPSSFDGRGCGAGQVEETLLGAVLVVLLCPKKVTPLESFGLMFLQNH